MYNDHYDHPNDNSFDCINRIQLEYEMSIRVPKQYIRNMKNPIEGLVNILLLIDYQVRKLSIFVPIIII